MGNNKKNEDISSEMLAAYLDGNATNAENQRIFNALQNDASLRELIHISEQVDEDLYGTNESFEILPMTALAATCKENNGLCCLECEKYILKRRNICVDEKVMLKMAVHNGWQKENGTALYNIGRHLEHHGWVVKRQYRCDMSDIIKALNHGDDVIVAVDGGELLNKGMEELKEDLFVGQIPDHTVVVLACDEVAKTVTVYDPNSSESQNIYSMTEFMNAWADSKNYLVTCNREENMYIPSPIDVSDVELDIDLTELREAIAENAHEIWAVDRQAEGWKYGEKRDENKKETPCMLPYSKLPEKEKEYDRKMAMNTLKLVRKMGYDFVKRENTELYKLLLKRIRDARDVRYCPYCVNEDHKVPIFRGYAFCSRCGHKVDWDNLVKL